MRKIASIQKIKEIKKHPNADLLEIAVVLGWNLCVQKGKFNVNDTVVFIEPDAFLPIHTLFEFMEKDGRKTMNVNGETKEGYRLRTVRLRGSVSQGLCLPISDLSSFMSNYGFTQDILEEGTDVTELMGIHKYEIPLIGSLSGLVRGSFPSFISKTDETRIQSVPTVLQRHSGVPIYVTEKVDGCLSDCAVIDTEDGPKTIKEVCDIKYTGKIKSFDTEKEEVFWDDVVGHSIGSKSNDWYEIELENGTNITLTGNHKVWVPELNCYRRADLLKVGDLLMLVDQL